MNIHNCGEAEPGIANKINYITNLNIAEASGGWSGMNYHVFHQLKSRFSLQVIQSVNPPYSFLDKAISKARRSIGWTGIFPAFTEGRLKKIATIVEQAIDPSANLNFFHGSTSWIKCRSSLPYAMYMDACFATYMDIYHNKGHFNARQLQDLYQQEAAFLAKAKAVFFSSEWALRETIKHYNIEGRNFKVAGLGGHLYNRDNTEDDFSLNDGPYFLFVSLDFFGKGGHRVVNAFVKMQEQFPMYSLNIVGHKPPEEYLNKPGIKYLGFIDKNKPEGMRRLAQLFKEAAALLLPTNKDITPLVLIEAGSVGCPVISVNNFGIPEIVKHMETGILIESGENQEAALTDILLQIGREPSLIRRMGERARKHITDHFTWDKTGDVIYSTLISE